MACVNLQLLCAVINNNIKLHNRFNVAEAVGAETERNSVKVFLHHKTTYLFIVNSVDYVCSFSIYSYIYR